MNIEVKGINEVLVLKCRDDVSFESILYDLNELLEQPFFQQDGCYPRAFFDFGCRVMQDSDIERLIMLINDSKKLLFEGFNIPSSYQHIHMNKDQIRNGEEIFVSQQTLFLGSIHTGAYVYCYEDVYFLNEVKGTIVAMNDHVKIYGHQFNHAQIMMNRKFLQNLTTSAFTSVYYKDNDIMCVKEDMYGKNHCFNIG